MKKPEKQYRAYWVDAHTLRSVCPECGKVHLFTFHGENKCHLNDNELDTFELVESDASTARLFPNFVCDRARCNFEAVVKV